MLVVTIELYPHGRIEKKQTIAVAKIFNNGSGNPDLGNYNYELVVDGKGWKFGTLYGFPRLKKNAWELLARILKKYAGKEKK